MRNHAPRLLAWAAAAGLVAAVLVAGMPGVNASDPRGGYYSDATDRIFWFIQASDTHIGTSGSADYDNLRALVTTIRSIINPQFVVVTGDLTDATDGNVFGWPTGPSQDEWNEYNAALSGSGVAASNYFDLPGNHDAYEDAGFAYYLANSVQGRATGRTQHSWTRTFSFGTYHFLGVNSADNTGAAFSLFWPYGDNAGLDASELAFIDQELANNAGAELTMVFGHHPVTDTGVSGDTWLFYGHQEFINSLDSFHASSYGYGHTHATSDIHFTGNSYTGTLTNGGIRYPNVDALGKDGPYAYRVFAIDCNGVSSVAQPYGTWPVVLITAPVSNAVGGAPNPYDYDVPNAPGNPIRALVFDPNAVSLVHFRVNGGAWQPMSRVTGSAVLWNAAWDASALSPGVYALEVQAVGSATRSHGITVEVTGAPVNQPPVARGDSYTTLRDVVLTVPASGVLANDSDANGDSLTAVKASDPSHGVVTLNTDGSFAYSPTAGYVGADSFTYTASDGSLASNIGTVSIAVNAPIADTVTITAATWNKRTKALSVTATSSAQPNVTLGVFLDAATTPVGTMTWNAKKKVYTFSTTVAAKPVSVTVKSSGGGAATRTLS